ncbi:hypothetical protein BHE74_00008864 [Ensete ventricosum]|uniref:Uncharacterized protein n=1 Tax=Ensete ventricosum TaxID=4639 RepID=A0A444DEJ5_ENSVE|nr:hypothetical protein GW17_00040733 [Ensete ventricosum]RWW82667.1 hypothetical protein BHE74_00008864 [Ensete ventricosum]RZR71891.1 hypothetical protein BHM03_00008438 [Ensete ventricosum]
MVGKLARLSSARMCKLVRVGRREVVKLGNASRLGLLGSVPRPPPSRGLPRDLYEGLVRVGAPDVAPSTIKPVPQPRWDSCIEFLNTGDVLDWLDHTAPRRSLSLLVPRASVGENCVRSANTISALIGIKSPLELAEHYCSGSRLVEHYGSGSGLAEHYCSGSRLVEHYGSGSELVEHYCSGYGLVEHYCSSYGLVEHYCSDFGLVEHYCLVSRLSGTTARVLNWLSTAA